jgi:DNA-nicking Smr family endonuclease
VIKKKNLSAVEEEIWENYTKDPSDIYDKEKSNSSNSLKKERFKFDFHGFTLNEANIKVKELILSCVKKKYKEILLITGKGLHSTTDSDTYVSKSLSKLKFSVPEFIKTNEELNKYVISISDAERKDGGEGALLIKLRDLQNKF